MSYKEKANLLLTVSAICYALIFIGQFFVDALWYEALYWLVQSALIGSVADWFAVTALFRRPLGITFHTELIPRNKERLINGLVRMVETKLLTYEQCEAAIRRIRFVPLFHAYITSDTGRITLRHLLGTLLKSLWEKKSEREWAELGADYIRNYLHKQSIIGPLQQLSQNLCKSNQYEGTMIKVIGFIQHQLNRPAVETWLTTVIDEEIEKRKQDVLSALLIGLSEGLDIINSRDMAKAMLAEMQTTLSRWREPNSLERTVWLNQWLAPMQALTTNRSVTKTIDGAVSDWIDAQDWTTIVEQHLCPYITELVNADVSEDQLATMLEQMIQDMWLMYYDEPTMRERLEEAMHHMALSMLEKSHSLIGIVVRQVLNNLSTEKFIYFIESKVEDDLSWIRINGAIVGGACGLVAWVFLTYVYEPLIHTFIG